MKPIGTWRSLAVAGSLAVASLALASPLSADAPGGFKNLKVLPKETSEEDLHNVMRSFATSLGVRCGYCHVKPKGDPNADFDWASDELTTKETARVMMKMTDLLNREEIPKVTTEHLERVEVRCRTCHHGQPRPTLIEDLLLKAYSTGGFDSLATKYEALRKEYYGTDTFNFGEQMLPLLAERLPSRDDGAEMLKLARFNQRWFPDAGYAHLMLGQAYAKAGEREAAIQEFRKAMEVDHRLKSNAEWQIDQLRAR